MHHGNFLFPISHSYGLTSVLVLLILDEPNHMRVISTVAAVSPIHTFGSSNSCTLSGNFLNPTRPNSSLLLIQLFLFFLLLFFYLINIIHNGTVVVVFNHQVTIQLQNESCSQSVKDHSAGALLSPSASSIVQRTYSIPPLAAWLMWTLACSPHPLYSAGFLVAFSRKTQQSALQCPCLPQWLQLPLNLFLFHCFNKRIRLF